MGKVAKTKENLKKCMCMKCPSYGIMCKMKAMPKNMITMMKSDISKVDHMEGMFCAFGKSKCLKDKKGCICGTCPVFKENKLNKAYYCID
jgi:hypothetical protein